MKKYIFLTITILLLSVIISSFAFEVKAVGLSVLNDPNAYIQSSEDNRGILPIANIIVWIVRTVGIAISVLMLSIIGIKYIMGSVEEKAEYKQTMWPYVVGAILIFGGSSLVNVIYEMLKNYVS